MINVAQIISVGIFFSIFILGCSKASTEDTPAAQPTQETCTTYLATDPSPSGLTPLAEPGATQRANFLASGGKIVIISNRYYTVSIPSGFYSATNPKLIISLPGTGGYPEAEWTDWNTTMTAQNYAFISLHWKGGTAEMITDSQVYSDIKQIISEVGSNCPISNSKKWLMGFSVGSAFSFAEMVLDKAQSKIFTGQIAISGSAINPNTSGKATMHSTVESNQSNTTAVSGVYSWLYCDHNDTDHTWDMCTEMPYGRDFINNHGGTALMFEATSTGHHSLPTNSAGKTSMISFIESH